MRARLCQAKPRQGVDMEKKSTHMQRPGPGLLASLPLMWRLASAAPTFTRTSPPPLPPPPPPSLPPSLPPTAAIFAAHPTAICAARLAAIFAAHPTAIRAARLAATITSGCRLAPSTSTARTGSGPTRKSTARPTPGGSYSAAQNAAVRARSMRRAGPTCVARARPCKRRRMDVDRRRHILERTDGCQRRIRQLVRHRPRSVNASERPLSILMCAHHVSMSRRAGGPSSRQHA